MEDRDRYSEIIVKLHQIENEIVSLYQIIEKYCDLINSIIE